MSKTKLKGDLVAVWNLNLSDGIHKVEFEHGTTSGKRVIIVDGEEIKRKDWMFKLVGTEEFVVGKQQHKARITIEACSGLAYEYSLTVDGKSLEKFQENKNKTCKSWAFTLDGEEYRVVLEKDTMDVWCNGEKIETAGEFTDDGTETHFDICGHRCFVKAFSSGNRREGILHTLHIDNAIVAEN